VELHFSDYLAFTLAEEGGFTDDPRDAGGATNWGITQATLSHWRGEPCTIDDVENLGNNEVRAIYHALYWLALQCDTLRNGLDLMMFDFGVNAGVGRAARMLQASLDVTVDGLLGPISMLAARGADLVGLIGDLATRQEAFYSGLADFPVFGKDWLARLGRRKTLALSMTRS
jgi:lysozyme family protein